MYLFRIDHSNSQYTKFLPWTSHMATSQHNMTSILNTLASLRMKTMAVEMSPHQFSTCQAANGQYCNVITPFQPLMNPPSCITALYTKNPCSISVKEQNCWLVLIVLWSCCRQLRFSLYSGAVYNKDRFLFAMPLLVIVPSSKTYLVPHACQLASCSMGIS